MFDFDFETFFDAEFDDQDEMEREAKAYLLSKGIDLDEEKRQIERQFMDYYPNREFSGRLEQFKMRRVDDGTFIDNGYR